MIAFRPMLLGAAALAALLLGPRPAAAVDLTMYYPVAVGGPVTKIIDDMVSRFEKENADIKVTAVYAGNYTDTMTKAMTAMKGGQPPQLSVLLSTDVFTLMDEKAIVPMDELVADKSWFKEFYPAFMANGQVDGKTWSIPFQRSTIVLYWNKDAFKEAGLDPEKAPASWDELVEMSKKLVKKDASGNTARWGVEIPTTGYAYWMLQALAIENGQKLMNDAGNEVYLTAPKTAGSAGLLGRPVAQAQCHADGQHRLGDAAHRFPRRQDRDDVAHHGQPDGGQGRRQVQLRRGHAAGQGTARLADRRRQLLHLQERIPRAAEGGREIHPVDDGTGACGGVEHEDRLRRGFPGGLQDPGDGSLCQGLPGRDGRAGSA